jgi:hypothetical protein
MTSTGTAASFSPKNAVNLARDLLLTAVMAVAFAQAARTSRGPSPGTRRQTSTSDAWVVKTNGMRVIRDTKDATIACGVNQCA